MKIIGFNLEQTHYGLPLDNGGACLIVDGEVTMMVNEERLNRKQYSPGYKQSLEYILENNNLSIDDIDMFVASSCLEPLATPKYIQKSLRKNGFDVPLRKIKVCGHHLSHAYTAYYPSGFDEAIIMVADGDGNVVDTVMAPGTANITDYRKNLLEHNSYFIGRGDAIDFLERDHVPAGENGLGGAYRYFTYFCGFPGYKYAGKLMGLSAYGCERNAHNDLKVFEVLSNGQITCSLPDSDRVVDSAYVVEQWFRERGVFTKKREVGEPISEAIEDAAYLIQRELSEAVVKKIQYLVEKTGIKNLCIAGGVGLNAVTNRDILDKTDIEQIYIQPASGDSGQCLGNAYFGAHHYERKTTLRKPLSVYQGKEYSDAEIVHALMAHSDAVTVTKMDFAELATLAAQKISDDSIIAWFQGRSEIGPRALGNRSILANPINKHMKDIINARVKHREAFRPFAPSVLAEKVQDWFQIEVPAPYMIMNAQVKDPTRLPSVTHEDGSARIQTVTSAQNPKYYTLISAFEKISGVPVVINTSFNDNEAIVETPEDALSTFLRTNIDFLFIGNYYVQKNEK